MKIISVETPASVVKAHEKEFPGIYIFYRHIRSKFYRLCIPPVIEEGLMNVIYDHCTVKGDVAILSIAKSELLLWDAMQAGYGNVMLAAPDESYWN